VQTNWIEDLWINSPMRVLDQAREMRFFQRTRPMPAGSRVLEIGCGRGMGAWLIGRAFRPAALEAIDINPGMIRLARLSQRIRGMREVRFSVADAQELPFPSGCMDAVFNYGIIHHLEDWQRGIAEVSRVLKPGGAFYFEEIYPALYAGGPLRHLLVHPRANRFQPADFHRELAARGLRLLPGRRETLKGPPRRRYG
jgi:ubiquinone/menaquinone biosynthesis C-methylase UbiE